MIDIKAEFGERIIPKLGRFWSDSEAESTVEDCTITEGVCPRVGCSRGDKVVESGGVEGPGEVA